MEFRETEAAKKRVLNEAQTVEMAVKDILSKPDGIQSAEQTKKGKGEEVSQQKKQKTIKKIATLFVSEKGLSGPESKAEKDKSAELRRLEREGERGRDVLSPGIGDFQEASLAGEERETGEGGSERDNGIFERGGEGVTRDFLETRREAGGSMEGEKRGVGGESGGAVGEVEVDTGGERESDAIEGGIVGGIVGGYLGEDENAVIGEGEVEEKREKKRKRKVKIGDLRVESMKEGVMMEPKSKLNEKKKKFLENKKMKKKLKGQLDQEFEVIQPKVKFGEVVTAPPKNLQQPRKKSGTPAATLARATSASAKSAHATSAHATSSSGAAQHWPESMGVKAASNERLREIAVSMYRKAKNWGARPGSAKLPESLVELE